MTMKVIRAEWLFDGLSETLIKDGAVLFEDGIISYAGAAEDLPLVQAETEMFEGATVLPGLIDAHVHLTMDGTRDAVQKVSEDSLPLATLRAVRNAEMQIAAGITTVRDCGSKGYIAVDLAKAVQEGLLIKAPRILAAGPVICITGGHGYFFGMEADGPDEVRKAVREVMKRGAHFIKLIATGGIITPGAAAGILQYNFDELVTAVKEASKAGLKTAAHAHGAEGIKFSLQAGISTLEHGSYIDDEGISLFQKSKTIFVSTLLASRQQVEHIAEIPGYMAKKISCHIDAEICSVKKLIEAGVPLAGGTDAGTPYNPHGELPEQLSILAEYGLGNVGALKAGTSISAKALGLEEQVGDFTPGKEADILVVRGNPEKNLSNLKNVLGVWKFGNRVI